jgi:dihydroorotate dehydrogenase
MWLWQYLARPALFAFDPEKVHEFSMGAYSMLSAPSFVRGAERKLLVVNDARLSQTVAGITFDRPLGLAAGFDKNARWFNELAAMGFGSIEVGTLTAHAQPGNDKPRLFRLPADRALINRLGFNNEGSAAAAARLAKMRRDTVLGINIGKSKVTSNEDALQDYVTSFERLFPFAEYVTVNVSSPNTAGLRDLQAREPLFELLSGIQKLNQRMGSAPHQKPKPVFVKIAPDLSDDDIDATVELVADTGIAGIIATNTTIARDGLRTDASRVQEIGAGGLSGAPLTLRSRAFVARLYNRTEGRFPIIGVGGIMNGDDAWEMIRAGATLIQTYTGFIYGGPTFPHDVHRGLLGHLDRVGGNLRDHVGSAARQLTA